MGEIKGVWIYYIYYILNYFVCRKLKNFLNILMEKFFLKCGKVDWMGVILVLILYDKNK